jgi:beta-lactamase superfamily II metal-dependent hydrolase
MTFHLSVLPAGDGDCLLLAFGDGDERRHVVVDGGRAGAYKHLRSRLETIRDAGGKLDLLVLTHIDADHIKGVLEIAKDKNLPLRPERVWYNGYDQMGGIQPFSFPQGDQYSRLIGDLGWDLNPGFGDRPVSIETRPAPFDFEGMTITLLSPDAAKLAALRSKWQAWRTADAAKIAAKELKAGVQAMGRSKMPEVLDVDALAAPTPTDPEPPNGSSIAFIAEWKGRRVLLAGDAHPDLLVSSLAPLAKAAGGRLPIDLLKVPHHGSKGNTTRELVELLDCRRFLLSTDGKRHGHPDPEAIARLLAFAPTGAKALYFNYRTERTEPWGDNELMAKYGYDATFGQPDGILDIEI